MNGIPKYFFDNKVALSLPPSMTRMSKADIEATYSIAAKRPKEVPNE